MTQIIEAVLFNDELELLEARFHAGDGIVDQWIIIESPRTFTGASKPLHFSENRQRFAEFSDRITWSMFPAYMTRQISDPWKRESLQRDWLAFHLYRLSDDSLVVLSDGDELTRSDCWNEILRSTEDGESVSLHKPTWYYTLTWALPVAGPDVTSFRSKAARVQTILRDGRSVSEWASDLSFPVIPDSGWHLSCLGGPSRLLSKLQSFSHQEINVEEWVTYENCQRLIQEGIDCSPQRNAPLTRTEPAGPEWLITEGVEKYPWLLTGEDPCIQR